MPVLLLCPRCGQRMKYQPRDRRLSGKTKKCVYCGFSMTVSKYILKHVP